MTRRKTIKRRRQRALSKIRNLNGNPLLFIALAAYTKERCTICGHRYGNVEDLIRRETVWCPKGKNRCACKHCYERKHHV